MNRRNFTKAVTVLGLGPSISFAKTLGKPQTSKVEILKHSPNTHYETLREYATEEGAIELVRHLLPRLYSATVCKRNTDEEYVGTLRSGYRQAVRGVFKHGDVTHTVFEIIDTRTREVVISPTYDDGWYIFDAGRAWAIIENIRVNGKPVQLETENKLPRLLTQPFNVGQGTADIKYVDEYGKSYEI